MAAGQRWPEAHQKADLGLSGWEWDGMGWVNAGVPMGSPGAGHGSARAPPLPLFPGLIPPYPALRIQEIKIDGEQIALARSSLLKRVVAGKQLPDVRKLSGRRTDRP